MRNRSWVLALVVVTGGGLLTAIAAQDQAFIRAQADQIAACDGQPPAQRDVCLAGRAMRTQDPTLCAAAKSPGCADLVASIAIPGCAAYRGEERVRCEIAVATKLGSTKVCRTAVDPDGCVAAVAADRRDVGVVLDNARDARHRDQLLVRYAVLSGDDSVLTRLTDPILHNKAVVLMAPVMAKKPGFTLTQDYCRRLRELPPGISAGDASGATPAFCRMTVAMAQQLNRAMDQAETDRERQQVAEAFARGVDAMAKSGLSAQEMADILDPGGSGSFAGSWTCPSRGTLTLTVSPDNSVSGTVSGAAGEHWGGNQRKGGSITGTAVGKTLKLRMDSGDGTFSNMEATLAADGRNFAGNWTWFRDKSQLGSGTWSCRR